jgi:hypothetical protein
MRAQGSLGSRIAVWLFLAMLFVQIDRGIAQCAAPRDGEGQVRDFKVSVDGKERGACKLQLRRRSDGSDWLHSEASIRYNFIVYQYKYSAVATETWKNDRLLELESVADYNGTRYSMKAVASPRGLQVTIDGRIAHMSPDIWVTSYWQIPKRLTVRNADAPILRTSAVGGGPARAEAHSVLLLGSDKGEQFNGVVTRVGDELLSVLGRRTTCAHYRLGGDVDADVWYDGSRRMVRQRSVDSGHKTSLELTRLTID